MTLGCKLKPCLFGAKDQDNYLTIYAPITGKIINLEELPDRVFADKIVGDGVAITPSGDTLVAPIDGTIIKIFESNHAFYITSNSGIEIFVHFGIDTVVLNGVGFKRLISEGEQVRRGTAVIKVDLDALKQQAKSTDTPIIISNMDAVSSLEKFSGAVVAAETAVLRIKLWAAQVGH